ncbi:M3 family metallopeptidase [Micavibrio aeruginosavorus]|uniref:M3 family metallopeptidase n=1 Tax=Micavibrio aeruginosavorus TaxID=349221 RepID=UPI003F4AA199
MTTHDDTTNPLIDLPALPHGVLPYDQIKPEHFKRAFQHYLTKAQTALDEIRFNPDTPTFENTVEALEKQSGILQPVISTYYNFMGLNTSKELMELSDWVTMQLSDYSMPIFQDEVLFARVKAVYDARKSLSLTTEKKTLLKDTYDSFVDNGVHFSPENKARYKEISEALSKATQEFEQNNLKDAEENPVILDDVALLKGVPQDVIDGYAAAAEDKGLPGKYLISDETSYPVMLYAQNRDVRARIQTVGAEQSAKGPYDNHDVIVRIVTLRRELANLMGYKTYAHMALDGRMAKTPETVLNFLDRNLKAYRPHAEEHLNRIKALALKMDGITDFKPSDYAYYNNINEQRSFNIDSQKIREYFTLDNVLKGFMTHAEKLFNIRFTETAGKYPTWHEDVKTYEIHDNKTGKILAVFYGDYFARSGNKQGGAWMNDLRNAGIDKDGVQQIPVILNCCNFLKPAAGKPALLSESDVITVFHEGGHGLHGILAKGRYPSQNGTNVARDFVELPSQLQENWAMEKEVLTTYAFHKDTGEVILDDLIEKIIAKSNYAAGYMGLRQTYFGLLDMEWQMIDPATITSVEDVEDSVIARAWLNPRTGNGLMSTSFSHIFSGGYAAGYYGYKWAQVLDADAFTPFKSVGLYDRKLGDDLRRHIYEKGGTRQASNLFRAFMGRNPDPDALLRREGLLPANDNATAAPQAGQKRKGPAPAP